MRLVATVDTDLNRAEAAMREYGAARCYDSVERALADDDIVAVVVCLPHHLHAQVAIQAAEHGKHCLVEKPLCTSVADADAMIGAAEKNGTFLMVAHVLRFLATNRKARELIQAGAIGKPLHIIERRLSYIATPPTPWWSKASEAGGLALALNGSHSVDTILWMTGERPVRVHAVARSSNPRWEGEDDFDLSVVTEGGTLVSIHHSFNSRFSCHDCVIIGSEGTLVLSRSALSLNNEPLPVPANEMFVDQLRHFAESVLAGRQPRPSGGDGRAVVAVLEGARLSIEHGATINVKERFGA